MCTLNYTVHLGHYAVFKSKEYNTVTLQSMRIVVCHTHSCLGAHTLTQKERVYFDPDIVLSKAPLPSLGNRCGTERGGVGGGEQYERWTNGLAAPTGIVLLAPFSHYTTVCVCTFQIR